MIETAKTAANGSTEGSAIPEQFTGSRRPWTAAELGEEAAGLMAAEAHIEAARQELRSLPSRTRGLLCRPSAVQRSESIGNVLRSLSLARQTLESRGELAATSARAAGAGDIPAVPAATEARVKGEPDVD